MPINVQVVNIGLCEKHTSGLIQCSICGGIDYFTEEESCENTTCRWEHYGLAGSQKPTWGQCLVMDCTQIWTVQMGQQDQFACHLHLSAMHQCVRCKRQWIIDTTCYPCLKQFRKLKLVEATIE